MHDGGDNGAPRDLAPAMGGIDARLAIWLSPAFPVGAFAYSHGLETAAHRGWIRDRATLAAWLADLVAHGSLRNDLILLAASAAALRRADLSAVTEINDLALALQPSAERHLETAQQGASFLKTVCEAWPVAGIAPMRELLAESVAYPCAVGVVIAAHGLATSGALTMYGIAFACNLVSAAIRLSVIGQTDGQRVMAALLPRLIETAAKAGNATLDDLGGAVLRSDVASLAHETQYTRLFRS